ncbi:NAD(P)H-binding protein [Lactobacillus rodentium]|uniref:NAD-dependent dehydratase n=1 Tax=Lactobacillus rodentium TaxID=947835 RepID=A0A2Z6T7W3_9LACO|nr:NAD(P)H-binding protein [Lactobacillus rodentium]MCR1894879.1 NAD(P)H-binding protein [Lactobacillus rodentium]GBG05496.1 NAD-dependent dehydratase [Lactobacillus rodentium]
MTNVLILGANGQIARLVEERLLKEQPDVELTLFLRNSKRLANLANNDHVRIIEGNAENEKEVADAMHGQDIVYVAMVDHDHDNQITKNVIEAMKHNNVNRIISSNILGIYNEVPGEFGRWNHEQVKSGLDAAIKSAELLEDSRLDYTIIRIPWLNNRDEIKYTVTHKNEEYVGVSGSRKSIADLIVKIIADPSYLSKESVGLADPDTQGESRPVY